ncbi:MAG: plasmid pRiA4b ORF-3 family protein [Spirochaetales bacterium]|nr:plasmid pRiA4b ORF-3 family protein [Spirochaetales bacterium]
MADKGKLSGTVRFRIELEGVWPPVWRRIVVSDRITLLELHEVIQDAFGWQDYHLHEFTLRNERYGDPDNDEYGEMDLRDETRARLWKLDLIEGEEFGYVYDFGDNWGHILRVEKIRPREGRTRLPLCVGGERACPPEDVGGIGGYAEFKRAVDDPSDLERESWLEWVGGAFDPEGFDLEAANQRMRNRARKKRAGSWGPPAEQEEGPPPWPQGPAPWPQGPAPWPQGPAPLLPPPALSGHEAAAGELALRRDVESLLTYIRDHKATGTQSTGNLPLKAVAEIAARFVDPPALERRIGEHVYRFRSEEDVWPVYFAHELTRGAELASGGCGRRWRLTPTGERFLAAPAAGQVACLFAAWWYRVDWQITLRVGLFAGELPQTVRDIVLRLLEGCAAGQDVEFGAFVERLGEQVGWTWTPHAPEYAERRIGWAVESMVIEPLSDFGVLSARYAKDPESLFGGERLVSFALTDFGRALLTALH